jgi:pimeloyl-ACP methyl ester carboxylesterase
MAPEEKHIGYCSWCFRKTKHVLVEKNYLRRNVYKCGGCRKKTLICRYCQDMAKGGDTWDDECCAVHDGKIADFKKLSMELRDITQWKKIVERSGVNMVKAGKITVGVLAGAGIVATGGAIAAPAIGGAVGGITGLSGAAAASKGLAFLGGGSLAAGGLGMAGGVAAVAISAGVLGGVGGGLLVNKYANSINGFAIALRNKGVSSKPAVVFVNGFLSEGESLIRDWRPVLKKYYADRNWYEVAWESKRLRSLGATVLGVGATKILEKTALKLAQVAARNAASKLNPILWTKIIADVLGNDWHVAMVRAEQTGAMLADLILRTKSPKEFVLFGHSLGARVVYYTLLALSRHRGKPRVREAHLFGGAVGCDRGSWLGVDKAVSGKIYNYYSNNDRVLYYLYPLGTLFTSSPIGRNPIEVRSASIRNVNVSSSVDGHGEFKPNAPKFLIQKGGAKAVPMARTPSSPRSQSKTQRKRSRSNLGHIRASGR